MVNKMKKVIVFFLIALLTFTAIPESTYALQPTKQAGTGTYKSSAGGFYAIRGFSMMFGGYTTSIALDDAGVIHDSTTKSAKYTTGFTITTLTNNERRARGSQQVRMADGSTQYYNYEIRINPANFDRNNPVKGRSLLDNLYLESNVNKNTLDSKLAAGGTSWINAIVSVRTGSQSHTTMRTKRLWTDGKSNYSAPTRAYSRSDVATAVTFSTTTQNILKKFYDHKFTFPKIDDLAPTFNSNSITGATYTNGSNYWVKPNGTVKVTARQHDAGSGNRYQYFRLMSGSTITARSRHDFTSSSTTNRTSQVTSNDVSISAVKRTENTAYGKLEWTVQPKKDGLNYAPQVYLQDVQGNQRGYLSLSKNIRSDGTAPAHNSASLAGAQYTNGTTHWVKPNTALTLTMRQHDPGSGNSRQYLRITGGTEVRAYHNFHSGATHMAAASGSIPITATDITINSAKRTQETTYGRVEWRVTPKRSGYTYTPTYHYTDNVGNANGYDTNSGGLNMTIKTDGVAPTVEFSNNGNPRFNQSQSTKVTVSDPLSGVKTRQYVWTTNTTQPTSGWTNFNNGATLTTPNGTGDKYLWVKAIDNVGNERITRSNVFKIDQTPPTASLKQTPTAWTKGNVKLRYDNFKDNDAVLLATGPGNTGGIDIDFIEYTATSNGTYNFNIVDISGNVNAHSITVSNIDKTKPTVSFATNGNNTYARSHSTKVSVSDTGSGVKTRQYVWTTSTATPTSGWANFNNGATLSAPTSTGNKYLWIKATDNAGNETVTRSNVFRIDTTAPTGSISHSPTGDTNGNVTISLTGLGDGHSGLYRTLRPDGTYSTATSFTYSVSANGTYTFTVYDKAGNTRTLSRTISNIDKTKPTIAFSQNGNSTYRQSHSVKATANDTGSGINTTQYAWSTNTTQPTSWTTFTNGGSLTTPDGTGNKYLWVKARDKAGNELISRSNVFRVDQTAPSHTSSSISGERYKSGTTYWTRPGDVLTVTYRQHDAHAGNQRGYIRLTGNSQDVRYFHSFSGTSTNMTAVNSSSVNTNSVNVQSVSRTEHNTSTGYSATQWKVKLNTSGHNYSVQYYHRDNASNNRGYTTVANARVDGVAPTISVSSNRTTPTNGNVTLTATASDTLSGVKRIKKPDGTWVNGTSTTHVVTANGTYTFVAEDNVGNQKTQSITVSNIDKTKPTIAFAPNGNGTYQRTQTTKVTASDSGSGINTTQYAWTTNTTQPTSWTNFTNGGTLSAPTTTGNKYLWVKATDKAGNELISRSNVFRIDTTVPTASTSQTPTGWTNENVTINVNASDSHAGIGSVVFANPPSNDEGRNFYIGGGIEKGTHDEADKNEHMYFGSIQHVLDKFKVGDDITISFDVKMDKGKYLQVYNSNRDGDIIFAPSKTFQNIGTSKQRLSFSTKVAKNTGTIGRAGDTWIEFYSQYGSEDFFTISNLKIEKGKTASGFSNAFEEDIVSQVSVPTNGTYNFTVKDKAGNTRNVSHNVSNIDKVKPVVSLTPNGNATYQKSHSTKVNFSDAHSGVKTAQYVWHTTTTTPTTGWANVTNGQTLTTPNSTGDKYLFVKVTDNAGNVTTLRSNVFKVDVTPPTASTSQSPTAPTNGNVTITVTASDSHSGLKHIKLPNGNLVTTAKATHVVTADGTYSFEIEDKAGNKRTVTHTVSNIDKVKPVITLSQTPTSWTKGKITIHVSATDNRNGIQRIVLPSGTSVYGSKTEYQVSTNGTYTFTAYDGVGNMTTKSITVTNYDGVKPSVSIEERSKTSKQINIRLHYSDK